MIRWLLIFKCKNFKKLRIINAFILKFYLKNLINEINSKQMKLLKSKEKKLKNSRF